MILDSDTQIAQKVDTALLQAKLSDIARNKADVIARNKWAHYYLTLHRKPKVEEFPPVVVTCAQDYESHYTEVTRHDVPRRCINQDLLDRLESRLSGEYGSESQHVKKNLIGHCAEPQAANKLLMSEYVGDIDEICFGKAFRPRTGLVVPACRNCQIVFDKGVVRW